MAPKFNMQAVSGGHMIPEVGLMICQKILNFIFLISMIIIFCSQLDHAPSPRTKGPAFTGRAPLASVPETKETPPMVVQKQDVASVLVTEMAAGENNDIPADFYLSELYAQLCSLLNTSPERFNDADRGG